MPLSAMGQTMNAHSASRDFDSEYKIRRNATWNFLNAIQTNKHSSN